MTGEDLANWLGAAAATGAVSGFLAYVTAVGTLKTKTAVLEEREDNHYRELDKKIDLVLDEVRAIRR